MTEKKIKTIYVGGPIDLANEEVINKRNIVHNALVDSGITVYNPSNAFMYGGCGEVFMKKVNDFAIINADAVLLIFAKDIVSIGTPIELQTAHNAGKLVIVVSPWAKTPCYIKALADQIFDCEKHALNFILQEVNKG